MLSCSYVCLTMTDLSSSYKYYTINSRDEENMQELWFNEEVNVISEEMLLDHFVFEI
jgi:hypothetical protein